MAGWLSRVTGRGAGQGEDGVNSRRQQGIIDRQRAAIRSGRVPETQRSLAIRLAVQRIAVTVADRMGARGDGNWHAANSASGDGIWTRANHPKVFDTSVFVGDREWEVLGELTGRADQYHSEKFGSSIKEQGDTLSSLVGVVTEQTQASDGFAPGHRQPPLNSGFAGPEDAHQKQFADQVHNLWRKTNFEGLVVSLESANLVTHDIGRQILDQQAPALELTDTESATRGFIDDMSAHSGKHPLAMHDDVALAPPAQKSWRIALTLMESSPACRDLPRQEYREAQEKLSVAIDQQTPRLADAERDGVDVVRREVSGNVLSALRNLEAEAAPAADAVPEKIVDPRVGVADPGSTAATDQAGGLSDAPTGAGAAPYRPVQTKPQPPSIG